MRLWSIHPRYLDALGLIALWREGLLARKVLEGKTRGYRNHPQLLRFRSQKEPLVAINNYLWAVLEEAMARDYNFDRLKVKDRSPTDPIPVTFGQLEYEWRHFLTKLAVRDTERYEKLRKIVAPEPHPIMVTISGGIEEWEKIGNKMK
ncbi:MAG: pyrimidine dimer DNA glycosylase/endonuclease V [Syntrophales bacterium]|nr:pyrimidine dimer DNA glycosylase/endonuclease V [Syntrophales bacterium]